MDKINFKLATASDGTSVIQIPAPTPAPITYTQADLEGFIERGNEHIQAYQAQIDQYQTMLNLVLSAVAVKV